MDHERTAPPFNDHRNIQVGYGRIIWAQPCRDYLEGWVLPGGDRTLDFERARDMAERINTLSGGARPQ